MKRSLLTGLAVLLPAALTVYILWLLFRITGAFFAVPVEFVARNLFGRNLGGVATTLIGTVLTVGLLVLVGVVAQRLGRNVFHRIEERIFRRLPVARGIHRAVRQLFELFFTGGGAHKAVGLVEYPRPGMYALCFITSREPWRLGDAPREQLLSVYLPTTPNPTSGYLLLVPKWSYEVGHRRLLPSLLSPPAGRGAVRGKERGSRVRPDGLPHHLRVDLARRFRRDRGLGVTCSLVLRRPATGQCSPGWELRLRGGDDVALPVRDLYDPACAESPVPALRRATGGGKAGRPGVGDLPEVQADLHPSGTPARRGLAVSSLDGGATG